VHTAIDDHSRPAYAEIHDDEKGVTCAGFLTRAVAFYASHGITVERVISENAKNYRISRDFLTIAADLGTRLKLIRPCRPWTNGKVEHLKPHPRRRMGLPPALHDQRRTRRPLAHLARPLQPRATTPRHRRTLTDQPRQQRCWSVQLIAVGLVPAEASR
jgi:hypothetical protein